MDSNNMILHYQFYLQSSGNNRRISCYMHLIFDFSSENSKTYVNVVQP